MVESFPGRNSQQIRSFLPPCRGGGSFSLFVFPLSPVCCDRVPGVIVAPFFTADAERVVMPVKGTLPISHWFYVISPALRLNKEAKPHFVNKTPSALGRTVNETNCKVPLWEDKKQ